MVESKIPKEELNNIIEFLSEIDLFKKFNKTALKDLANSMTVVSLGGGGTLINQGDLDATLYILYQGRLRVYVRVEGSVEMIPVAELSVGQIVGEIALLTNEPRTGTVCAIRDSILLKLDKETFQRFEKAHPEEVTEISKTAIKRLITKSRPTQFGENIVTIAVAPAGDSDHRVFIPNLIQELNKIKPTLLVNQHVCNEHFGRNIAQTRLEEFDNAQITTWLQQLENQYGYIVYETDRQLTPWTQRCLRQADRLFLVAEDGIYPTFNSIEINIFSNKSEIQPYIEMVFIYPPDKVKIVNTKEWLKSRNVFGYHHLRLNSSADLAKFIRFLTGQAFGVVLNGGGARGFAHIGVLKALDELKVPIDFIAGTSMGAILAAAYALVGSVKIDDLAEDFIKNYHRDYTFPMVSLLKGKFNTDFYQKTFGDTYIEDLWTRFFCVSTNLTQAKLHVHHQGLLWFAIRASTSIPAIFPPVYDEEGNILVDGGIINNMPVDVMRKLICGGKVMAVNCYAVAEKRRKKTLPRAWISGWQLLLQRFNPFSKEDKDYDNIFNILVASLSLGSVEQQNRMEREADYLFQFDTRKYGLLEFTAGHKIIEFGYQTAMEKLPEILKHQKLKTK